MSRTEEEHLSKRICQLREGKQSAKSEKEIALLEFELKEVQGYRNSEVSRRARLLFHAYINTGRIAAIHPNGQRREGAPLTATVSDVQAVWNVRSTAENLAEWSTP